MSGGETEGDQQRIEPCESRVSGSQKESGNQDDEHRSPDLVVMKIDVGGEETSGDRRSQRDNGNGAHRCAPFPERTFEEINHGVCGEAEALGRIPLRLQVTELIAK